MSALAKPLTHTTNTIGGVADPVNIEAVTAVTTTTIDQVSSNNAAPKYTIVFHFGKYNEPIVWRYATEALRDTDLATLLTNNSVAL